MNGNAQGSVKLEVLAPFRSNSCDEIPIYGELLNAIIVGIHNQYVAVTVHCHSMRFIKLSIFRAMGVKRYIEFYPPLD